MTLVLVTAKTNKKGLTKGVDMLHIAGEEEILLVRQK